MADRPRFLVVWAALITGCLLFWAAFVLLITLEIT